MKILVTGAGGFIGKSGGNEVLQAEPYTSANTEQLDVDGTIKKLLAVDYVQTCLQGGEPS